jgi:hypothetical protein
MGDIEGLFQETVPEEDAVPGAVIAIQSFGDFLGFNPHVHILCTDGCFYGNGMFRVAAPFDTGDHIWTCQCLRNVKCIC